MEFRKIKETEQEQAIYIISQSFYYDCKGEYKLLEKGKFRYQEFFGAFDEHGKMIAITQCEPHYMWLDGVGVKSGGIANVACLPENRRSGLIRETIKLALGTIYEEGYVMSYLYPFSYPYYRKFGYELCNEMYRLEASPKDLVNIPFEGTAKQFEPGDSGSDPCDIIEIYNIFSEKYNIMLDRDAWQWEKKLEHNPVTSKTRTYVIYDKDTKARAYFTYDYDRDGVTAELSIKDLAWTDYEAMNMLFAFIGRFAGNVIKISFHLPPDMVPSYLWQEPRDCEIFYEPSGMARIVNAKKALETFKKPGDEGNFTIKINDDFMEQNNKSYKVSWKNGKSKAKEYDGECDIECSIMALTQILTGFVGLEQAETRSDLTIINNSDLLTQTFPKKMVYIADFF